MLGLVERGQQRMPQRTRQDAADARVFETQLLAVVNDKPGALIVPQRLRVVEGAAG